MFLLAFREREGELGKTILGILRLQGQGRIEFRTGFGNKSLHRHASCGKEFFYLGVGQLLAANDGINLEQAGFFVLVGGAIKGFAALLHCTAASRTSADRVCLVAVGGRDPLVIAL